MFTSKLARGQAPQLKKKGEKNSANEVSQVVLFFFLPSFPAPSVEPGPRLRYNLLGA